MRVVMSLATDLATDSIRQFPALARAHRGETDIDGAEHQRHDRADELHPFLLLQSGTGLEQPHLQKIRDEGRGHDDQNPADEFLAVDHRRLPGYSAASSEFRTGERFR